MSSISVTPNGVQVPQEKSTQLAHSNNLPIVEEATEEPDRDEEAIKQRLEELRAAIAANLAAGFTQMPDRVRRDPTLSRSAKIVYEQLLSYMRRKDHCWPSQKTIANDLGTMSRRTVIRALKELYERGFIDRWRRGQGKTNFYFLNPLTFPLSFQPRGQAILVAAHSPEHQAQPAGNPPDPTIRYLVQCQNDTSRSDKEAQQEASEWHTKHTNYERDQWKDKDSKNSTAEKGTVFDLPSTTIRNEQSKREDTNTKRDTNTSENSRAGCVKGAEGVKEHPSARAIAIAEATGIPAAHLAEMNIAQEPRRRPIPDFINSVMARYTNDLGDSPRSARSNITRAAKLYYFGLDYCKDAQDDPEGWYTDLLYEIKQAALAAPNIKKRTGTRVNRIPIFFFLLEEKFGFSEDELIYIRSDLAILEPEDR